MILLKKIKSFIVKLWGLLRLPEMLILPGNLAFYLILSLAPIITLFGIIASSFSLSVTSITNFLSDFLPRGVTDLILPLLDGSGLSAGNFIFVIIMFFIASNGADSLIIAANTLYDCDDSNYLFRKVKSLFLIFWILVLFLVILILMAFGSFILTKILTVGVVGKFIVNNYILLTGIKVILAFFITFVVIKIVYTLAPSFKLKSKYVNVGAMFATLAIMIVSSIYSFYVTNIAHYDIIYGGLANIAILMLLVYFISYIIVLGMAINKNYYNVE